MGVLCEYSVSMQKLIILLAVVCTACGLSVPAQPQLQEVEPRLRNTVHFNTSLHSTICTTCTVVKIESTAGAAQNQPDKLGTFEYAGAMWENTVPFFKNDRGMFLTPDPSSNPVIYRLKWVVSEIIGGINAASKTKSTPTVSTAHGTFLTPGSTWAWPSTGISTPPSR